MCDVSVRWSSRESGRNSSSTGHGLGASSSKRVLPLTLLLVAWWRDPEHKNSLESMTAAGDHFQVSVFYVSAAHVWCIFARGRGRHEGAPNKSVVIGWRWRERQKMKKKVHRRRWGREVPRPVGWVGWWPHYNTVKKWRHFLEGIKKVP